MNEKPVIYAVQKTDYNNGDFRYYIEKVEIYSIKGDSVTYENVASLQPQYALIGLNAAYSYEEAIELEKGLINSEFVQEDLRIEKTIEYINSYYPEKILYEKKGDITFSSFFRLYLLMRRINSERSLDVDVSGTTFTHWDNETRRKHGLHLKEESEEVSE